MAHAAADDHKTPSARFSMTSLSATPAMGPNESNVSPADGVDPSISDRFVTSQDKRPASYAVSRALDSEAGEELDTSHTICGSARRAYHSAQTMHMNNEQVLAALGASYADTDSAEYDQIESLGLAFGSNLEPCAFDEDTPNRQERPARWNQSTAHGNGTIVADLYDDADLGHDDNDDEREPDIEHMNSDALRSLIHHKDAIIASLVDESLAEQRKRNRFGDLGDEGGSENHLTGILQLSASVYNHKAGTPLLDRHTLEETVRLSQEACERAVAQVVALEVQQSQAKLLVSRLMVENAALQKQTSDPTVAGGNDGVRGAECAVQRLEALSEALEARLGQAFAQSELQRKLYELELRVIESEAAHRAKSAEFEQRLINILEENKALRSKVVKCESALEMSERENRLLREELVQAQKQTEDTDSLRVLLNEKDAIISSLVEELNGAVL
ncbi:hypothetical protein FVE85_1610 [Porphyridium purpureum]|uniref:Uncharacterized protein n=1 Tax=Porphyridium purpureum TaxID=35688 RepID=A0A5J4YW06_PORPP|nr:hypothetical protein FVE85_1610 [Porphyridium purpureum]|eukprot:POR5852..scf209_3